MKCRVKLLLQRFWLRTAGIIKQANRQTDYKPTKSTSIFCSNLLSENVLVSGLMKALQKNIRPTKEVVKVLWCDIHQHKITGMRGKHFFMLLPTICQCFENCSTPPEMLCVCNKKTKRLAHTNKKLWHTRLYGITYYRGGEINTWNNGTLTKWKFQSVTMASTDSQSHEAPNLAMIQRNHNIHHISLPDFIHLHYRGRISENTFKQCLLFVIRRRHRLHGDRYACYSD